MENPEIVTKVYDMVVGCRRVTGRYKIGRWVFPRKSSFHSYRRSENEKTHSLRWVPRLLRVDRNHTKKYAILTLSERDPEVSDELRNYG